MRRGRETDEGQASNDTNEGMSQGLDVGLLEVPLSEPTLPSRQGVGGPKRVSDREREGAWQGHLR